MSSEPMTPAMHKAEAERLLAAASEVAVEHSRELARGNVSQPDEMAVQGATAILIARAQVHATLATITGGGGMASVGVLGGPYA